MPLLLFLGPRRLPMIMTVIVPVLLLVLMLMTVTVSCPRATSHVHGRGVVPVIMLMSVMWPLSLLSYDRIRVQCSSWTCPSSFCCRDHDRDHECSAHRGHVHHHRPTFRHSRIDLHYSENARFQGSHQGSLDFSLLF